MAYKNSQGYVLFTALIFMILLAILGVTTLQGTNVEFRMSANTAYKKHAFERAESGRAALSDVIEEHVNQAGTWPDDLITGENAEQPSLFIDALGSEQLENLSINDDTPDSPNRDAFVLFDFDDSDDGVATGSTLASTPNTDRVDISVYNLKTILAQGNSIVQQAGYLGQGRGAAGGGAHVFYQIQASATASANASSTVAVDFRVVP